MRQVLYGCTCVGAALAVALVAVPLVCVRALAWLCAREAP
jgi:hypothetical protein